MKSPRFPEFLTQAAEHFSSGVNAPGEARGFALSGRHIGITANVLRPGLLDELAILGPSGGARLFVDSGAFSEVKFGPDGPKVVKAITDAEWMKRFDVYRWAAATYGVRAYLVAPDRVGCQETTLALLSSFAAEMQVCAMARANIIVPVQKGKLLMSEMFRRQSKILGLRHLIAGIPMKKDATSMEDLAELVDSLPRSRPTEDRQGARIHLLGIGPKSPKFAEVLALIKRLRPHAKITSDSASVRGMVGRPKKKGHKTRELTAAQDEARARGIKDPQEIKAVGLIHQGLNEIDRDIARANDAGWFDDELFDSLDEAKAHHAATLSRKAADREAAPIPAAAMKAAREKRPERIYANKNKAARQRRERQNRQAKREREQAGDRTPHCPFCDAILTSPPRCLECAMGAVVAGPEAEPAPSPPRPISRIRAPILRAWTDDPLDIDLFAGGGGASEGKRRATGSSPNIAVNHWPAAIAMHKVNHPDCHHFVENVYKVKPIAVTRGKSCRLLWASPTCTHFSRASGCKLKDRKLRGLAWSIIPWIKQVRPELIILENVIEFLTWGPLHNKHHRNCKGDSNREGCRKKCPFGKPIKDRMGETFEAFQKKVESYGYSFEAKRMIAWEYGAPTTRERLYIQMRADGKKATWPEPSRTRENWRTAAEIIDWTIPCPSVFDRKKPHVPATRRRLAKGIRKFVLETSKPFLMHLTHGDRHAPHSIDAPVPTITCANRGEQTVVVPYMIHRGNGERRGQEPRTYDVQAPHPTVVAGGIKASPVVAFLAKAFGERRPGEVQGQELGKPIGTVTSKDHHHLVAAHTIKFYGTSTGAQLVEPLGTVTAGGEHHGVVAASLMRYNGERRDGEAARGVAMDQPMSTIDTSNRFALVEAAAAEWNDIIAAKARRVYNFLKKERHDGPWMDHENEIVRIPGTDLVIYDIGMRMLIPRELFRANGFRDDYVIDLIGPRGKPLTKTEQIRMVGNSVAPDVAEALIRAALPTLSRRRMPERGEQMSFLEAA